MSKYTPKRCHETVDPIVGDPDPIVRYLPESRPNLLDVRNALTTPTPAQPARYRAGGLGALEAT